MTDKKKVFTETAIRVRSFIRGIKAAESGWTFPENNELAENANWILERIKNKDWLNFFVDPGMSHQEIIEARRKLAEKVSCAIRNGEAVNIESPVDNGIRRFKAEVMEVYEQCRNESMTMFDVVPELVFQGQTFATNIPKEYKEKLKDVTDLKVRKELMKEHDIAMGKALVQFTGMSQYILEINNVKGFDISLFEIGDYVAPAVPTQPEVKGNEMKHNDEAKAILEAINLVASNTNKSLEEMRLLHAEVMAEYNRIGAMHHPFSIPQNGMLYQQANGAFERPQPQPQQPRDGFGQPRAWPTNPVEPIPVDLGQIFQKAQGFSPVQAAQNAFNVQPNATYTSPDFIGAGFDSPPVGKVFVSSGDLPTGKPNAFANVHQGHNRTPAGAALLTPVEEKDLYLGYFMNCLKGYHSAKAMSLDELESFIFGMINGNKVTIEQLVSVSTDAMKRFGNELFDSGVSESTIYAFLLNKKPNLFVELKNTRTPGFMESNNPIYKNVGIVMVKVERLLGLLGKCTMLLGGENYFLSKHAHFNMIQACYIYKNQPSALASYFEHGALPSFPTNY